MVRFMSWVRLFVGLVLAVEVIRQWIFGSSISMLANVLAALLIGLAALYFVFRF